MVPLHSVMVFHEGQRTKCAPRYRLPAAEHSRPTSGRNATLSHEDLFRGTIILVIPGMRSHREFAL